ncbi:unnamed protein product [Closterium sp. NIES-54]
MRHYHHPLPLCTLPSPLLFFSSSSSCTSSSSSPSPSAPCCSPFLCFLLLPVSFIPHASHSSFTSLTPHTTATHPPEPDCLLLPRFLLLALFLASQHFISTLILPPLHRCFR